MRSRPSRRPSLPATRGPWAEHTTSSAGRGSGPGEGSPPAPSTADGRSGGERAGERWHGRGWSGPPGARWWLAQSHAWWGINLFQSGDFASALCQLVRAARSGKALGDPRLEGYADFLSGWFRATRGEWEAGIRDCNRRPGSARPIR